ncbi:P-loop containing nucleoside triphosphate hydrolase protein [Lentinula raphanica]|nr:P-loop containing nucleoside triphosphate hydrolase protein [Lentinula raphanica]
MSLCDISSSSYALRRKEFLSLNKQLHAAGAQSELGLPQITVIGNQSAGKSSLLEAITGITVPRDAGTCTRCPIECRLSSSDRPWSCQISIRQEFDNSGERLRNISEKKFGEPLTDKVQVELSLRRAQFAILNPHVPWYNILAASAETLASMSAKSNTSLQFSKNIVCVDLEGPEFTELSFIDLPGLVQNAHPDVVELVENLVISRISGNCIILVTVPMTDDIENQKAFRLARQVDPEGCRTIGVLTKPDMLQSGSSKMLQNWLDVLEGRRHPLQLGYFCTRQPDDDERMDGALPIQAREKEEDFFKNTLPWCNSESSARFGTKRLVDTLSRLLTGFIRDSLPKILSETNERLSKCQEELSTIPPPLKEEPAIYVLSQITRLCSEIQTVVQGSIDTPLIQSHRTKYNMLKLAIRGTAPKFVPFTADENIIWQKDLTDDDDDKDSGDSDYFSDRSKGRSPSAVRSMNLTDVRQYLSRSITRELPNNIPFSATVSAIRDFQKGWPQLIKKCFEEIQILTLKLLMDQINQIFGRFLALQTHIRILAQELSETHRTACALVLSKIIEVEGSPFTQNTHYLQSKTNNWLVRYKAARAKASQQKATTSNSRGLGISDPVRELVFPPSTPPAFYASLISREEHEVTIFESIVAGDGEFSRFSFEELRVQAYTVRDNVFRRSGSSLSPTPVPASVLFQVSRNESTESPSNSRSSQVMNQSHSSTPEISPSTPSNDSNNALTPSVDFPYILNMLAQAGIQVSSKEELVGKLSLLDAYEKELKFMAEVRGYYQVAYKRIIDYVPGFIDLMFVKEIAKELQPFLVSKLQLGTPSGNELCANLLREDPSIVSKRDELLSRQKMLEHVQRELVMFGI